MAGPAFAPGPVPIEQEQSQPQPQCHALNLSDAQPCTAHATAYNKLFCSFHAKQCFGLYMGYKRRNLELDALTASEPAFLKASAAKKTALVSQTFAEVSSESELHELHDHLFRHYVLLGKVISARKLHHKHFFSLEMDYGHKAYLDRLISTRQSVLKALENLERRTAEVLYEKEKWYGWVRQVQDEEESKREKEQKMVKLEAALFRRHWKEVQAHLATTRKKEETKRQEMYLEEVWKERMASSADEGDDSGDDAQWDPIEDVFEDDRGRYLDLIRHFLWMPAAGREEKKEEEVVADEPAAAAAAAAAPSSKRQAEEGVEDADAASGAQKKKVKKRGGKKKNKAPHQPENGANKSKEPAAGEKKDEPDKSKIESKEDIRKRLEEGVEKDYSHINGPLIVGTAENPMELFQRTAPVKGEDATKLIDDITEIKVLLFCRQIMSHSTLLPAALRATSVEEFLADPSVSEADLRDLCLKVEQPTMQSLRDACADFARGDEPDADDDNEEDDGHVTQYRSTTDYIRHYSRYGDLENGGGNGLDTLFKSLKGVNGRGSNRNFLKGLAQADQDKHKEAKMRVRICGRSIWNYTSQRSMARDGWLQFSVMAKDCSFDEAIGLCRNWDEFFELQVLALWQYFPAARWTGWSGNYLAQELTHMGFIPFCTYMSAEKDMASSYHARVPKSTSKQFAIEPRNYICAHMKRNDPVTRRFIQYALMRPGELLILVRDGTTGRIIVAPEKPHRWILRSQHKGYRSYDKPDDYVSSADDGWTIEQSVDTSFFEEVERERKWRFGFTSYYEIYIWEFVPGGGKTSMYNEVIDMLMRAHRIKGNRGKFQAMKHIMETLTREKDTMRVRQIKPNEDVQSLYDELAGPKAEFFVRTNRGKIICTSEDNPSIAGSYSYYNETDAAEDAILFEEEAALGGAVPEDMPFVEITNPVQQLNTSRMPLSILRDVSNELDGILDPLERKALSISKDKKDILKEKAKQDRLKDKKLQFSFNDKDSLDGLDDEEDFDSLDEFEFDDGDDNWEDEEDEDEEYDSDDYVPGAEGFPFSAPPIWTQAHKIIQDTFWSPVRAQLLKRVNFSSVKLSMTMRQLIKKADKQEILERDRGYIFKDTFHLGDLEPGAQERYKESMALINGMQKYESPNAAVNGHGPSNNWAWYCMELLDWLKLKIHYNEYAPNPQEPWPHRYILQDIVQAFMMMGLFFPNLPVTSIIQEYLATKEGAKFKSSDIFDIDKRTKTRPDRRNARSMAYRPKKFWNRWDKDVFAGDDTYIEKVPKEWNMVIRPIIAKLYRAGMIGPATIEPNPRHCPGFATANTEEAHRPGKLDLFIKYSNSSMLQRRMPPGHIRYEDWPALLPVARKFAASWETRHKNDKSKAGSKGPRFALLRLWSAPHFYPAMLGLYMRQPLSFLDPVGRAWEWFFIPKDMPMSEWSVHNTTMLRLGYLREQMDGKVVHRGDLVLVMGEDEEDLMRWCVAVTFALQTKPWLREVDLWKSFVNVDLEFLEGLGEWWLD
ncbi:hypothetical protein B0T17DRAFT_588285 [Bombardia bombarda]|uniref:Uncharacterized protein n=1 Tax=Bombardia bombarda TaxID=252184 RepID=A0AA39XNS1_9PEZI|nr:hypothetical protein B0T17DRAFT_588285 [Bombardia bombarda]